jgi:hypothetical protein
MSCQTAMHLLLLAGDAVDLLTADTWQAVSDCKRLAQTALLSGSA